jgi:hypothetical protein
MSWLVRSDGFTSGLFGITAGNRARGFRVGCTGVFFAPLMPIRIEEVLPEFKGRQLRRLLAHVQRHSLRKRSSPASRISVGDTFLIFCSSIHVMSCFHQTACVPKWVMAMVSLPARTLQLPPPE